MKIALCISGQPRSYHKGYEQIKKYIFNVYSNIDVYTHFWFDESKINHKFSNVSNTVTGNQILSENTVTDILRLYNPVAYKIEKEKDSYEIPIITRNKSSLTIPYATFSQYYSFMECVKLINKEYDIMIKARFDTNLMNELNFSEYEKNFCYFSNDNMNDDDVNDGFFWGDFNSMVKISNLYLNLNEIYEKNDIPWCNEKFLKIYLNENNINYKKINIKVNWFRND